MMPETTLSSQQGQANASMESTVNMKRASVGGSDIEDFDKNNAAVMTFADAVNRNRGGSSLSNRSPTPPCDLLSECRDTTKQLIRQALDKPWHDDEHMRSPNSAGKSYSVTPQDSSDPMLMTRPIRPESVYCGNYQEGQKQAARISNSQLALQKDELQFCDVISKLSPLKHPTDSLLPNKDEEDQSRSQDEADSKVSTNERNSHKELLALKSSSKDSTLLESHNNPRNEEELYIKKQIGMAAQSVGSRRHSPGLQNALPAPNFSHRQDSDDSKKPPSSMVTSNLKGDRFQRVLEKRAAKKSANIALDSRNPSSKTTSLGKEPSLLKDPPHFAENINQLSGLQSPFLDSSEIVDRAKGQRLRRAMERSTENKVELSKAAILRDPSSESSIRSDAVAAASPQSGETTILLKQLKGVRFAHLSRNLLSNSNEAASPQSQCMRTTRANSPEISAPHGLKGKGTRFRHLRQNLGSEGMPSSPSPPSKAGKQDVAAKGHVEYSNEYASKFSSDSCDDKGCFIESENIGRPATLPENAEVEYVGAYRVGGSQVTKAGFEGSTSLKSMLDSASSKFSLTSSKSSNDHQPRVQGLVQAEAIESEVVLYAEATKDTSLRFRRLAIFFACLTLAATLVGILVPVLKSRRSSEGTAFIDPRCILSDEEQNVIAHCACKGTAAGLLPFLIAPEKATYERLLSKFKNQTLIDPNKTFAMDSCEPENQSLLWISNYRRLRVENDDLRLLQTAFLGQLYVVVYLYLSMRGDEWEQRTNWLSGIDVCNWFGIEYVTVTVRGIEHILASCIPV